MRTAKVHDNVRTRREAHIRRLKTVRMLMSAATTKSRNRGPSLRRKELRTAVDTLMKPAKDESFSIVDWHITSMALNSRLCETCATIEKDADSGALTCNRNGSTSLSLAEVDRITGLASEVDSTRPLAELPDSDSNASTCDRDVDASLSLAEVDGVSGFESAADGTSSLGPVRSGGLTCDWSAKASSRSFWIASLRRRRVQPDTWRLPRT